MKIKTGDKVIVLAGRDKKTIGKVLSADPKTCKVTVEGVNVATKHQKPRKQGQDLHVILVAQLTGDGPEDTSAAGVLIGTVDKNCCVLVETNIGAVGAADGLRGADYDRLDDVALLDGAAGSRLAHGCYNDVTDACVSALGTAKNADALDFLGAGIVGNLQITFLLYHLCCLLT